MDLINQINLGSNFVRPIELINRLIQTQSKLLQKYTKKIEFLGKDGCSFWWNFGLEHFVQKLFQSYDICWVVVSWGDKSEKVCTDYKVQPTKNLNLFKESECHASVQIVLCNFFLYINNIQKYYSVSRCDIFIIIMFAPKYIYIYILIQISNVQTSNPPLKLYNCQKRIKKIISL